MIEKDLFDLYNKNYLINSNQNISSTSLVSTSYNLFLASWYSLKEGSGLTGNKKSFLDRFKIVAGDLN